MAAFTDRERDSAADGAPASGGGRYLAAVTRLLLSGSQEAGSLGEVPAAVRRLLVFGIVAYFLLGPAASKTWDRPDAESWLLLAGALVFLGYVAAVVARYPAGTQQVPWGVLIPMLVLSIVLFVVDGTGDWIIIPAMAAGCYGRFTTTPVPAAIGAVACGGAGLAVSVENHAAYLPMTILALVPALAAFFSYTSGKRSETQATLRQTRAELARMAVAQERLRIARDLHDLLGHSLSLITLKAELSRRLVDADPASAAREMAELETVARQSLSDVRAAVAGYRKPDLTAELGAARQLLAAAGIACQVITPETLSLPSEVDTVLAWAVREGVTNVVRHSRAARAVITVARGRDGIVAEITDYSDQADRDLACDDRALAADDAAAGPAAGPRNPAGSGLAGLGERVRRLGGDLTAGPTPAGGFRLRITIPAGVSTGAPAPPASPVPASPVPASSGGTAR